VPCISLFLPTIAFAFARLRLMIERLHRELPFLCEHAFILPFDDFHDDM